VITAQVQTDGGIMANNPTFTGFEPEVQDITRQREMAKMLLQKGMADNMQGQMVSGRYVGASPWQGIANMYAAYSGRQLAEEADKKQADLAKLLREGTAKDLLQYNELMYGKQGTPDVVPQGQTLLDDQGQVTIGSQRGVAPVQADPRAAYEFATQSRFPQVNAMATEMMKPQKLGADETMQRFNPVTGKYEVFGQGATKLPADIQGAAIFLGLDKKPRDQWTPQDLASIEVKAKEFRQAGAMNTGQKGLDNTLKLRSDFRSEPIYKDFQAIDSAYRQINKGLDAGTAAGDLAASTKLMKLLDPTSVVRESELAMAMQATGKLDQLYNYANKIATGQFLSPKQKEEFRSLSKEFYNSAGEQYNLKRKEYADIASRNELNVADVVGSDIKPVKTNPPAGKGGLPTPQDLQAEIDRRLGLKQQPKGGR
jgi:hypothetical protein